MVVIERGVLQNPTRDELARERLKLKVEDENVRQPEEEESRQQYAGNEP